MATNKRHRTLVSPRFWLAQVIPTFTLRLPPQQVLFLRIQLDQSHQAINHSRSVNKQSLHLHPQVFNCQSAIMFRAAVARNVRLFSTNVRLQKSATESVKDGLKAVDRTVSDAAVKGIEKGGMFLMNPLFPSLLHSNHPYPSLIMAHGRFIFSHPSTQSAICASVEL